MQVLRETDNYTLTIGQGSDNKGLLYLVTNKKYGIVEIESTMLPQAIKYLYELEAGLAAVEDIYATEPAPKILKANFNLN